jgi:hypothetical protein
MSTTKTILVIVGIAVVSLLVMQKITFANSEAVQTPISKIQDILTSIKNPIKTDPMANAQKLIGESSGAYPMDVTADIAIPTYPYRTSNVEIIQGVAIDRYTMFSEDVIILRISGYSGDSLYFLIGNEIYKMNVANTRNYNGVWLAKMTTDKREEILLTVRENGDNAYISGSFRNYLMNFEPYYFQYYYPTPLCKYDYVSPYAEPVKTCETTQTTGAPFWK